MPWPRQGRQDCCDSKSRSTAVSSCANLLLFSTEYLLPTKDFTQIICFSPKIGSVGCSRRDRLGLGDRKLWFWLPKPQISLPPPPICPNSAPHASKNPRAGLGMECTIEVCISRRNWAEASGIVESSSFVEGGQQSGDGHVMLSTLGRQEWGAPTSCTSVRIETPENVNQQPEPA